MRWSASCLFAMCESGDRLLGGRPFGVRRNGLEDVSDLVRVCLVGGVRSTNWWHTARSYIWQLEKKLQEYEDRAKSGPHENQLRAATQQHQQHVPQDPSSSSSMQRPTEQPVGSTSGWSPSTISPAAMQMSGPQQVPTRFAPSSDHLTSFFSVPQGSPAGSSQSPSTLTDDPPFKRRKTMDSSHPRPQVPYQQHHHQLPQQQQQPSPHHLGPPDPHHQQRQHSQLHTSTSATFARTPNEDVHGAASQDSTSEDDDEVVRLTDFHRGGGHDPLSNLVQAAFDETGGENEEWGGGGWADHSSTAPCENDGPQETRKKFVRAELSALRTMRAVLLDHIRTLSHQDRLDPRAYDRSILDRMAGRYFRYVNCPLPVLHEEVFAIQLEAMHYGRGSAHDLFQILMVMASTLASLSRNNHDGSELGRLSAALWQEACRVLPQTARKGWRKLQNTVLLMQYGLLVPSSDHVWRSCWEAMRLVVELGLYSPATSPAFRNRDPLLLDILRRLFWTTYSIDRMLSCTLGRASTLSDRWVMTEWPATVDDAAITSHGIQDGPQCHLKVSNLYHFRLRRLQSEVLDRLYIPGGGSSGGSGGGGDGESEGAGNSLDDWTQSVQTRLRHWLDEFKTPTPFLTFHWVRLQYSLTITMLLRPSPRRTDPSVGALQSALTASGEVMSIYHQLHREAAINFGSIAMRNLFVSGLTFLNSLKGLLARNISVNLALADIAQQIQSCNVVLECLAASEGSSEAGRVRDAFDVLSRRVFRALTEDPSRLPRPNPALTPVSSVPSAVTSPSGNWPECFPSDRDRIHFFSHDRDHLPQGEMRIRPDPMLYAVGQSGSKRASSRSVTSDNNSNGMFPANSGSGNTAAEPLLMPLLLGDADNSHQSGLDGSSGGGLPWPETQLIHGADMTGSGEPYGFCSDWATGDAELIEQFGLGQLWNSTARAG